MWHMCSGVEHQCNNCIFNEELVMKAFTNPLLVNNCFNTKLQLRLQSVLSHRERFCEKIAIYVEVLSTNQPISPCHLAYQKTADKYEKVHIVNLQLYHRFIFTFTFSRGFLMHVRMCGGVE